MKRKNRYKKKDKLEYWLGVVWAVLSGSVLALMLLGNFLK
jgi:hypothetical protein